VGSYISPQFSGSFFGYYTLPGKGGAKNLKVGVRGQYSKTLILKRWRVRDPPPDPTPGSCDGAAPAPPLPSH